MDKYEETFETWNKVASLYQDKFMNLDIYNETYNYFCNSVVKPNAKILEIACGPGNIAKYLLSKRPDFEFFGIDIAPNMVALAAKNNPKAKFVVMDSREISSLTTKYNGIVCGFCLPYLSQTDRQKLIKDCKDLLTDNGSLYISFIEGNYDKSGFQTGSSGDKVYFYYHNLDDLKKDLIESNFKDFRVFKVEYENRKEEIEVHTIITTKKTTTT